MTVHFVLPEPVVPSGGNAFDRRVADLLGLRPVHVGGRWPREGDRAGLARALAGVPDGGVALLDGLVACGVPELVRPHVGRVRVAVLVHLPLVREVGLPAPVAADLDARERECLRAVDAVVATSPDAARWLAAHHGLRDVRVVPPGVDPAPLAPGTDGASRLLCVASLTPRKGHDVLLTALRTVDAPWTCAFVGPGEPPPGLDDRVEATGPLVGADLDAQYARADLFVLASRAETYGMVVTEALARGLPVIASAVPDALGDGGVLLPPGDAAAFGRALRHWFADAAWRDELRLRARRRRTRLSTWDETAAALAEVLASLRP
ncbi:glycosyltransferase family 4 protein [Saccharothrix syringae]|uniref:Glycosyltransferase n=1 Tax=Saccharothrix syringae TaxID=103733 RepID=A0A5Q0GSG7_SACSY|nr:glycosyltransferase family 4 protein [Saccharothrix syringae]QFZ16997.1 glycosyltransferase [Saccharothrix syringae]